MRKLGVVCGITWSLRSVCSLVFLPTAKLVWEQTKELYSGVNNLKRIYDLHQNYFSLSM